jgi:autotransporter-associated beta strand protein
MKRKLFYVWLLLIPIFAMAQAGTDYKTWTGSGNWSNSGNWTNGYGYGQLEFKGGGSAASNNDNSPANQWRLYFQGSQAYTITGNQINLFDFGGNFSWILNDATVTQTIQNSVSFSDSNGHHGLISTRAAGPLVMSGNLAIGGTVPALKISGTNVLGTITIGGVISGSGKPIDIGRDDATTDLVNTRVFFNGVNTYSGPTSIYAGTLTVPANTALGSGNLNIGNAANAGAIVFTGDTSRSQSLTVADGSSAAAIDVASGKTFELTGVLAQTGSNQATKIGKSGAGTLTLSGTATYNGQIQIGQGTVILNNNAALGINNSTSNRGIDLGLNVSDGSQPNNVSLLVNNGFTIAQSVYIAPNTGGATRTIALNGAGTATLSNEIYIDGSLTVDGGTGTLNLNGNGSLAPSGGLIVTGGTVVLGGSNTYTGNTVVNAGTLRLGAAERISNASNVVLGGGNLSTNGNAETLGTLNLTAATASTITVTSANHTLTFGNSSSLSPWGAGASLTIAGWNGTAGQSNVAGAKIIVGAGGLTLAQLAKISFSGYAGTPIIVGGELVPPGPTLAVTLGSLNHGSICEATAATPITYTLANTGGNASAVTVTSNSSEFVVSNQSSTTVNGGSSITYQVTFTPNTSGTRNGTITINTGTANSNAPVTSNVTGSGIARTLPTFNSIADICYGATLSPLPTISTNGITGTWSPTLNNTLTTEYTFTPTAGQCAALTFTKLTIVVNQGTTFYTDSDNDGFGALANPVVSCAGQPAGTVTNSTDCNDNNHSVYRNGSFYVDEDNDGYYNGNSEQTVVCYGLTTPSGYTGTIIGTDCNDTNAEINPNHVEVLGNNIDDNCDGTADEVAPLSAIRPTQCGTTTTSLYSAIYANQVSGAQGYRFEVTNGASVRTYDSATSSFNLLNLTGGATYATTYSIRVAVKTTGFWRAYSSTCTITTPAVPPTTNVIPSQCGSTLTNLANTIYCDQVTSASQYRFEVSDGVNPARTYDSAVNRFNLGNLTGGGAYATTYAVRVALNIGGTWYDFGTSCNITTPLTPTPSNVVASQCGITISNSWTTIYATQVAEATGYRFEVVNGASTRFYDTPNARFNLHNLTGAAPAPSTVYTIRVAILYNSVYQPFGTACTITTAGAITRQAATAISVFDVNASPNPFADRFSLDVNTSGEEQIGIKVYDMIGREIESRQLQLSAVSEQEIGSQFPSGVYNIVVSQGDRVKTIRVIKR